ncbi:MAG TPA: bacillithiol biosynthesis cysteine-adding enzyme BshC [Longimicrobiales bacterium]
MTGRGTLNLEIRISRITGSRLVQDYQEGRPEALAFFRGPPRELESFRAKVADVDHRFDAARRRRVAEFVRAPTPGAAAKLEEVLAGDGLFVTTGQQPGLFTGPLYTIYKALAAVRLADALERGLGRPVLPVFWIASDDHDWAEANHTFVLDRGNALHRIELAGAPDAPPASMRNRLLGAEVESAVDEFVQHLPVTEFADRHLELIRTAYRAGRSVADAFTELLTALLEPFELGFVDGGAPELKAAATELVERELVRAAEHEALMAERAAALEAAGYGVQVPVLDGATNVLYEDESGRDRVFREGPDFVLRRTGRRFGRDALLSQLRATPERFSANVALRPVVESALLPTVAYVGGPGEIRYFAQLGPLFEAHGVGMPVAFPRFGVTLLEPKVRKVLDKFGVDVDDFRRPAHELAARVLREELPAEVTEAIGALRRHLTEGYDRLARAAREIDPTLKGPLEKARNAGHVQLSEVEKKIVHHLKMQSELGIDQLGKARANLFPDGHPQERVLNVFQYLVRFGPELLGAVAERMEVELDAAAVSAG